MREDMSMTMNPERLALRETRDCAVRAITAACWPRFTYKQVHRALKRAGRAYRSGTYDYQLERAMKYLKIKFSVIWPLDKQRHHEFRDNYKYVTTPFVVNTPGHYTAFREGRFTDHIERQRTATVKRYWRLDHVPQKRAARSASPSLAE